MPGQLRKECISLTVISIAYLYVAVKNHSEGRVVFVLWLNIAYYVWESAVVIYRRRFRNFLNPSALRR